MGRFTGNRSGLALAVVSTAQFVVVLDATAVTTALPVIGSELGAGLDHLQWVLSAYTLAFAGFLVVGGRIADVLGARRTFVWSLVGFTAASLVCGLAHGLGLLIAARLVQGLAAALLSPAALAVLSALETRSRGGRDVSIAVWTAVGAGGGASGWVVGGLLAGHASWRWVFLVNLPIGLAALALTRRHLPRPGRHHVEGLDLGGALAVTAGLGLLVWGLTGAADAVRTPARVAVPLVGAALALGWFRRHERRTSAPLLPPRLLADRPVRGANLVALLSTTATTSAVVLAVLYLQDVLRLPPGRAAFYFPAFNVTVVVGSLLGPRVLGRLGPDRACLAGFLLIAAGAASPALLADHLPALVWLSAALAVMGLGLGLTAVTSTTVGLGPGVGDDRGLASGVLTSAAQVGNAVGFAFIVPFATGTHLGTDLGAMRWGFLVSASVALLGALASRLLAGRVADATPDPAPARTSETGVRPEADSRRVR